MNFFKKHPTQKHDLHKKNSHSIGTQQQIQVLEDYDLLYIHSICQVKKIDAGEIILENKKSIDSIYIITNGSLEVTSSSHNYSYHIKINKGEIFGFIKYEKYSDVYYTIRAQEESNIIEISQRIFLSIPEHIKGKIFKKISKKFLKIFPEIVEKSNYVSEKNSQLISYIYETTNKKKDIVSTELIQNLIRKIPRLPTYANDLLAKLMDEHTSIQEIANPIQKDPSLAGIVLKTVNSAYYGLQQKISDVPHAIVYLGFNNVYQIIVNHAMKKVLPNTNEFHEVRTHSTLVSIICHEIASLSKKSKPLTMTTTGLLHDIGKIVIYLLKGKYQNIQELFDVLDDAAIGASLLQSWDLPECVFQVIENHRVPEFCPPENLRSQYSDEIAILYIAHAYYDILTETCNSSIIYLDDYISMLGIHGKSGQQFYEESVVPALVKNQRKFPQSIRTLLRDKLQCETFQ
jgi:HD-like signal output (HDOD) protein